MTLRTITADIPFARVKPSYVLWGLLAVLLLGAAASLMVHASAGVPESLSQSSSEADLVVLTNLARRDLGLASLQWNAELYQAAERKAVDMLTHQYFDHTSPTGVTPWSFIHAIGYQYTSAGENLAEGFVHDDAIVRAWIASPAHRANIVDPGFTDIAIATKTGFLNGKVVTVVVQMFGQPTSFVSQIDRSLLGEFRRN